MHNIKTNFDKILGVVKDIIGCEINEKGNYLRHMEDIKNVWLLSATPIRITFHQGSFIFRILISGNRILYKPLQRDWLKRIFFINTNYALLPVF